ncbi:MAG TPA: glycosyltransferase family 39 protein, partial [Nitrososphaeraceae archaeon]|nr:glycosyltransferase family 39 protein [Nitrososphaeraceae archaeon]
GRAVNFIDTHNPKDPYIGYDHPYFGQIFLAAFLYITNYQSLLDSHAYFNYEILFLYPRILMGLLALLDTFLLFKIVELRYNTNVAVIATLIFALMPITWLTRWILLDAIQLPFILLSLLLAIKSRSLNGNTSTKNRSHLSAVLLSGVSLGLAIFTKIPAFTMIPIIGYLIWNSNRSRLVSTGIWLIPTILIPSIWIFHAGSTNELDVWWNAINGQLHREDRPFYLALYDFFTLDPLITLIAIPSLIYSAIKRDVFVLLLIIPYFTFMYFIGYVVVFHILFFVIIICISAANFLVDILRFAVKKKYLQRISIIGIGTILIFGLYSTTVKVTTDINLNYFSAAAYIGQYLESNLKNKSHMMENNNGVGIVGHPFFFWIERYALHNNNGYYLSENKFENTEIISVFDRLFRDVINEDGYRGKAYTKLFSTFDTKKIFSVNNNSTDNDAIDILLTNLSDYNENKINVSNLLDEKFEWTNAKYTGVVRSNGEMNITMDTTEADSIDNVNRVFLSNPINLTETASYLYLKYYNPFPTEGTFTIELNDIQSNEKTWSKQLKNEEKEKTIFFILPENVAGKKVKADIRIHSSERDTDSIILKNWSLYY